MLDAGNRRQSCGQEETLIAFVYGEISEGDRLEFEKHMTLCVSCSEEVSAFSTVSDSIVEWKEETFDKSALANVASAIAAVRIEEDETESKRGGIFGLLNGWTLSMAGSVALVLIAAIFGWALFVNSLGKVGLLIMREIVSKRTLWYRKTVMRLIRSKTTNLRKTQIRMKPGQSGRNDQRRFKRPDERSARSTLKTIKVSNTQRKTTKKRTIRKKVNRVKKKAPKKHRRRKNSQGRQLIDLVR